MPNRRIGEEERAARGEPCTAVLDVFPVATNACMEACSDLGRACAGTGRFGSAGEHVQVELQIRTAQSA